MMYDRKYTVPFLCFVVLMLSLWTIKLTRDQQNIVYSTPKIRPHSIDSNTEDVIRHSGDKPQKTLDKQPERKPHGPTEKQKQSETKTKQSTNEKLSKAQIDIGKKVETKLTKYLKLDFSHYKQNKERGKLNYLLHTFRGRLGNYMSQVAAMLGIALKNDMIPAMGNKPCFNPRQPCFARDAISSTNGSVVQVKEGNVLKEKWHSHCDARFSNLSATYPKQDLHINGYLFCPAYYEDYQDVVRRELTWNSAIRGDVINFFQELAGTWGDKMLKMATVGIHVRREEGFGEGSPKEYFRRAVSHFRNTIQNKDIIFIVSGNNKTWNEENIKPLDKNIISMRNSPEVDMAIFQACDHMITSKGTFSYWAGFLGEGIATYFMNSKTRNKQEEANRFPKNFVGIVPEGDTLYRRKP